MRTGTSYFGCVACSQGGSTNIVGKVLEIGVESSPDGITIEGMMGAGIGGLGLGRLLTGVVDCSTGNDSRADGATAVTGADSSALPSLTSVTVDGSLRLVLILYPSAGPIRVDLPIPPIPLGIPRSKDLEELTATGGFGRGRLVGDPNPLSRSRDLTEDTVSERSRIGGDARANAEVADRGEDGPASMEVPVVTRDGSGRFADGRTGGGIIFRGEAGDHDCGFCSVCTVKDGERS